MLKIIFIIFFVFNYVSIVAQNFNPNIKTSVVNQALSKVSQDDIKILAVMVEFQTDDFDLTFGDGTFGSIYSEDYGNDIIDPLPHDKNYFEDHLQFALNYYDKVSNGRVNIDFTVLPDIYTVSKAMREYSPVGDESFKVLADFSKEVWELVNNSNSGVDFSEYNTFIIFHAGVGKDISTSDLFGEARDLPSIYLSEKALQSFYGEAFNGFQLNDGTLVNHSIILPETESREISGFGGVSLLQLSINGLLVSSIASHLGLPDLFDAETGKSAIGRFGLMDGQSLFAYAGLFPPQPSAWEKIYLGWEQPIVINSSTTDINVIASLAAQEGQNKIIKIPINSTEYYLIENRTRDANKDGVTITYKVAGQIRTINFTEDLDNFNNAFVDTLKGVVLDVDEFDWAIPGSGILIWHIDEKIVNETNIAANRVNVGKNRGVDLEEADGIQDIGEEFQTIFGDIIIAEGDEFDFWYEGNTSRLYKNKFGTDTKPNTNSNSGANSLITFSNFSGIDNEMSFDVNFENENVILQNVVNDLGTNEYFKLSANSNQIKSFAIINSSLSVDFSRSVISDFTNFDFSLAEYNNTQFVVGTKDNFLNIAHFDNEITRYSIELESNSTAPILLEQSTENEVLIYVGLNNGSIKKYNYNLQSKEIPVFVETISFFSQPIEQIIKLDNEMIAFSGNKFKYLGVTAELEVSFKIKQAILTKDNSENYLAIILDENNMIHVFEKEDLSGRLIKTSDNDIESISVSDLKKDGGNYIVYNESNKIKVINTNGSSADQFPYENNNVASFVGNLLVADLNNDGFGDIISLTDNGNIYAVSGNDGKLLTGFPISVGGNTPKLNTIVKRENDILLSVTSSNNDVFFWSINSFGNVQWGSKYGNNFNASSIGSAASENSISTFFPKNKTYNWPNPVYGDETYIRTYVSENSNVAVKIFDLAGDLVDEFSFNATGGLDTEFAWNVNQIQSGAYFAHLEIKSNSGKTDSKIIKIAVVK